jgi:hypothetical protein
MAKAEQFLYSSQLPPRLCGMEVPPPLAPLAEAIERSREILRLEDDWDGEGSPAYREADWQRAVCFLLAGAAGLHEQHGLVAITPQIFNGPDGSIELLWEHQSRRLLLNVPAGDGQVTLYGRDASAPDRFEVKGALDPTAPDHRFAILMIWLAG